MNVRRQKTGFPECWADFWRYTIGVNVIPADSRNKKPIVKWNPLTGIWRRRNDRLR